MKTLDMRKMMIALLVLWAVVLLSTAEASRIKELAQLEGVRSNQLVGYGLVVGLNGTGDSSSTQFTIQSLVNMMERLGVTVDPDQVDVANVAAVVVTASLPAFARAGSTIDVAVSSVGDADNLAGGTLLMTPLKAADGKIYAVAQGALVVGSLAFGGKAAKVQKNHPTAGRIPDGALVEREVPFVFGEQDFLNYRLKDSDFTTVSRMSEAVNEHFGGGFAHSMDAGQMRVQVPQQYQDRVVDFVAELERLDVIPDTLARIVVNEKTGTIVMGEGVRISTVAVSHGNLSLVISEQSNVSQPNPLAGGDTVVTPGNPGRRGRGGRQPGGPGTGGQHRRGGFRAERHRRHPARPDRDLPGDQGIRCAVRGPGGPVKRVSPQGWESR